MFREKLFFITLFLSFVSLPGIASPLKSTGVNRQSAIWSANTSAIAQTSTPQKLDGQKLRTIENTHLKQLSSEEEALLREQIQSLEDRQLLLEQELELLRQQVEVQLEQNAQNETVPIAEEPIDAEIAEAEQYPMGFTVFSSVGTFDPKTSALQDFAIVDQGNALVVGGDLATIDYEPNEAIEYGATLRFEGTPIDAGFSSVIVTSSGAATATAPPNGFLFATLANPGQNEEALTASANSDIRYSVTDLEAGYRFDINESIDSRLYGGIRFADISQNTTVLYDGVDFTNTAIGIERAFSGTGLHVGNRTNLNLGSGFSLFGQAEGALIVGDVRSRQQEVDNNGLDEIASLNQASSRVVPMIDLAAGINWQQYLSDTALVDISFGYAIEEWFDVLDVVRYVDSSGSGVLTQDSSNLSSSGLFFELGFTFDF